MKSPIIGLRFALLLVLATTTTYATIKPEEQTRGIFSMLTKSTELLAKARKVLKNSNDTSGSIFASIDAINKTLATTDRSPNTTNTLAALLQCYVDILNTTMILSCKEYEFLDQVGEDLVSSFDSTVSNQIAQRNKTAKTIAAALEKLSKQIITRLQA